MSIIPISETPQIRIGNYVYRFKTPSCASPDYIKTVKCLTKYDSRIMAHLYGGLYMPHRSVRCNCLNTSTKHRPVR